MTDTQTWLLAGYLVPMLLSIVLSGMTIHQEGYVRRLDLLVLVTVSLAPVLNIVITLFYLAIWLDRFFCRINWNQKVWIRKPRSNS